MDDEFIEYVCRCGTPAAVIFLASRKISEGNGKYALHLCPDDVKTPYR